MTLTVKDLWNLAPVGAATTGFGGRYSANMNRKIWPFLLDEGKTSIFACAGRIIPAGLALGYGGSDSI